MPLLGSLLVSLFGGLASFFAQWLTKKAAMVAAGLTTFGALNLALFAAFSAAINAVQSSMPGGASIATGVWLAIPDNGALCFATAIACDGAVALYRWNVGALKLAASAG